MRTILLPPLSLGAPSSRAACVRRVWSWLTAAAVMLGAADASAQVSVEFAEGSLAPAAEEMAGAGVDGSQGSLATLIEIAQRYGFGYGISPDEVRELVGSGYLPARQIDCSSLDAKAEAATRLSRALSQIAWLYAAGAGLTYISPPVAAALGLGALISGMGAAVAAWLAQDYRAQRAQIRCTSEGGIEWFRPIDRHILASAGLPIVQPSSRRSYGASPCA